MVEITSRDDDRLATDNYLLPEDTEPNSSLAYMNREPSVYSESQQSEVEKDAAINKMKKLAEKIYDTTPGIADCKLSSYRIETVRLFNFNTQKSFNA